MHIPNLFYSVLSCTNSFHHTLIDSVIYNLLIKQNKRNYLSP